MTMTEVEFDSDLFDAEILVERSGHAYFTKEDLAELIGMSVQSIWRMVATGTLPPAAWYEDAPGKGRLRAHWSCAQAAEALARRLAVQRQESTCGTLAAWRRHRRLGEPVDDACRAAKNAKQRSDRLKRRAPEAVSV